MFAKSALLRSIKEEECFAEVNKGGTEEESSVEVNKGGREPA